MAAFSGEGVLLIEPTLEAVDAGDDGRGVVNGEIFVFGSWNPGSIGSVIHIIEE